MITRKKNNVQMNEKHKSKAVLLFINLSTILENKAARNSVEPSIIRSKYTSA